MPMQDFCLPAVGGKALCLHDWRGKNNLVLFFAHSIRTCTLCWQRLVELSTRFNNYADLDAKILAVLPDSVEALSQDALVAGLPFPVLADELKKVHRLYAAQIFNATPDSAMLFILDRYTAPYVAWVGADLGQQVVREVESWLNYLEIQCPE